MRTKIILRKECKKAALCNRDEYFKKYSEYDKQGCFKKMQAGAPLVVNIDGVYYYYDKLMPFFGCVAYDEYRTELMSPMRGCPPVFIWR